MNKDTVVKFHNRHTNKLVSGEEALNILRLRMYEWAPKDLAEQCGVTVSCIYAIRGGRTKWPRDRTLFALVEALDFELRLVDVRLNNDTRRFRK